MYVKAYKLQVTQYAIASGVTNYNSILVQTQAQPQAISPHSLTEDGYINSNFIIHSVYQDNYQKYQVSLSNYETYYIDENVVELERKSMLKTLLKEEDD